MDMDQEATTTTTPPPATSTTVPAIDSTATTTKNIGTNTPSIESETSTTTISMVSSNTNPFMPRTSKNNPFSVSNNNRMDTETKGTSTKYDDDDDDDNEESDGNRPVTNNRNDSMGTRIHHQYQQTAQTQIEPTESHTKSTMVDDFEINNLSCCASSLPRKFERLNLSTSLSTDSEIITTTSKIAARDTNAVESNTNKSDYEGTVSTDTTNTPLINNCHSNGSSNNYCCSSIMKSPSNPFVVTLTTTTNSVQTNCVNTNNELACRMISKCLSQSSSTTTITSSSSRTSSMLIESPSLTMSSMWPISMPPSPPPPPPLPLPPQPLLSSPLLPQLPLTQVNNNNCNINNNNNNDSQLSHQPLLTNYPKSQTSLSSPSTPQSPPLPPLPKLFAKPHMRILPKTHSLDLADEHVCIHIDQDDVDADVDEDDDSKRRARVRRQIHSICGPKRGEVLQTKSEEDDRDEARGQIQPTGMKHSKSELTASTIHSPPKGMIPKIQATIDSRPIYPNVPYSPYGSPYGSPRSNRRRTPLRESRRISIEQSGSFLQLNQYKLMDQIGQGSYGLVKLAYSEEDSTHYAMKILSKRRLLRKAGLMGRGPKRTTSPLDRVYREIAVLKKLDHPNVVKLVEVLDDPLEDSLYLVFELVQQGEVLSIPTDRPLSEERAWCVFRDALQGLEYLHYQRIIHADIKPGNLLLGECGRVKIADLGVCNEFLGEDATMNNGSTAGTPAFRAPETLIPGQHLYSGKAADIWALGATLYALVYGNVPFVAKSIPALYEKIKHDQLKFPEYPKISNELRDLIEKILTKDPSKRITLPQIKEHNWVTSNGAYPLPSEEENCRLVQISDEDIHTVVKSIPKLDTLILIKTMLKNHSFQNPFSRGSISGRAPQRGGSRLERFTRAGRSNSAPGAYHLSERQLSSENILPSVSEGVASSCNESSDQSADG